VAKLFELFDRPIFDLGHYVSGHTLKHLAAALSAYLGAANAATASSVRSTLKRVFPVNIA
jgi:hypothetical protein